MPLELVKEKIVLDQKIGNETTQILFESDFIVPDIKPDLKMILHTDGKVTLDKSEISQEKVEFSGTLQLNILYLARNSEKPVHNMMQSLPINEYVNIDGLTRDMWAMVDCDIIHLECKMINERKLNIRCIIGVKVSAYANKEQELVKSIDDMPEVQLKKASMNMNRIIQNKDGKFVVKDEFVVPSSKPNIREVLQSKISILNREIKVGDGKVAIKGDLSICTLYVGDTDSSIVEYNENEIPFNGAIEIRECTEDMYADVTLKIYDKYIQVKPDADGEDRVLDAEVTIMATVKLSSESEIDMLEDAYCINKKMVLVKSLVNYPKTICRNKNQSTIKESVQLDSSCPPIMQIYHVTAKPVIDDIKVLEDKVIAEGAISSDIIYVAESDETPLYSYSTLIPFKQQIETKSSKESMQVDLDSDITHISFNMLSSTEVEVRYVLNLNVHVIENQQIDLITDLTLEEADKAHLNSFASMTIYVVQSCDSLWKIARKYNTSIDEIVQLNDIENPDKIYPGQKLLILKRAADD